MKTLHPSISSIWSILHPDLLNIPQLSIPLLLKIGQRCVENDWANGAGKVAALPRLHSAGSSPITSRVRGHQPHGERRKAISAPPSGRFYESQYCMSPLTFPTANARAYAWEEVRWESCRNCVRCRRFPGVDESAYAAFQRQMAEEAFSGSKKRKMQYHSNRGALNNISS